MWTNDKSIAEYCSCTAQRRFAVCRRSYIYTTSRPSPLHASPRCTNGHFVRHEHVRILACQCRAAVTAESHYVAAMTACSPSNSKCNAYKQLTCTYCANPYCTTSNGKLAAKPARLYRKSFDGAGFAAVWVVLTALAWTSTNSTSPSTTFTLSNEWWIFALLAACWLITATSLSGHGRCWMSRL
jgi:hypothetical protein